MSVFIEPVAMGYEQKMKIEIQYDAPRLPAPSHHYFEHHETGVTYWVASMPYQMQHVQGYQVYIDEQQVDGHQF